jgi:hypothetical protein
VWQSSVFSWLVKKIDIGDCAEGQVVQGEKNIFNVEEEILIIKSSIVEDGNVV